MEMAGLSIQRAKESLPFPVQKLPSGNALRTTLIASISYRSNVGRPKHKPHDATYPFDTPSFIDANKAIFSADLIFAMSDLYLAGHCETSLQIIP
jgi:hypothetical protein